MSRRCGTEQEADRSPPLPRCTRPLGKPHRWCRRSHRCRAWCWASPGSSRSRFPCHRCQGCGTGPKPRRSSGSSQRKCHFDRYRFACRDSHRRTRVPWRARRFPWSANMCCTQCTGSPCSAKRQYRRTCVADCYCTLWWWACTHPCTSLCSRCKGAHTGVPCSAKRRCRRRAVAGAGCTAWTQACTHRCRSRCSCCRRRRRQVPNSAIGHLNHRPVAHDRCTLWKLVYTPGLAALRLDRWQHRPRPVYPPRHPPLCRPQLRRPQRPGHHPLCRPPRPHRREELRGRSWRHQHFPLFRRYQVSHCPYHCLLSGHRRRCPGHPCHCPGRCRSPSRCWKWFRSSSPTDKAGIRSRISTFRF